MSAQTMVRVSGSYSSKRIVNTVFPLLKGFTDHGKGAFITVDPSAVDGYPEHKIRIKVKSKEDFAIVGSQFSPGDVVEGDVAVKEETDAEAIKRIRERFDILDEMTQASVDGVVRGLVVTGPPGVGKSYGVETVLDKTGLFDKIGNRPAKYEIIKGAMTPLGLYALLYNNSDKGTVLVLDDCDSILWEELALNLLKGALDSTKNRKIHWNADSALLRRERIPDHFEFNGSLIFITNLKFDNLSRKSKISDHLEAILSRCHYLDLTLDSMRDKMLRIKQIVGDGMLEEYHFTDKEQRELVRFIDKNKENLREVSLRMVLKIADLRKMAPRDNKWKRLAETTCMVRNASV